MSNSLWFHGLQYVSLLCPSLSPRVCSNSCHWVTDVIVPFHPLALFSYCFQYFPIIRVFSNEPGLHIRWPNYWSFSFSISPSNEYSGLIFYGSDQFGFLVGQGTLKSLQHHNSKASVLQHSTFFMVLTSIHDYWENHSFDYTSLCW